MLLRRLIGPTLITLVMIGLWLDYLFFRDTRWSAINFLSKVFVVLGKIFVPFFNPAVYSWLSAAILPAVIIACGIIFLYVVVTTAKVAMSRATPNADELAPIPQPRLARAPLASPAESAAPFAPRKSGKLGLVGKLSACFCALSLLFGVAVIAIVYPRLAGGLEKEIKRHAGIVALSLSEAAKRYATPQGESEFRKAMDKYAASNSVAYIYLEDARGRIVAHRPQELPIWLHRDFPKSAERALNGVEVDYRGSPVYEIAARVGERDGGFVHFAVWRDEIQNETRQAVAQIAASILLLLSGLTVIFALAVWSLSRPFMKIVALASRISKGELDLEIDVADANEVGDLARSFERMRSSLHAVLTRLENEEFPEQSKEQD